MASVIIQTLGPYDLLEPIGRGAMSTVYKGYDPRENRHVAIKVLPPALAQLQQIGRRFQREIRVVMQLEHPNIMPVVDFGEDGGNAYLVMPYLKFGTLAGADRFVGLIRIRYRFRRPMVSGARGGRGRRRLFPLNDRPKCC